MNQLINEQSDYILFTKDIFNKQKDEIKELFPFYCPDDKPYLCININSKYFGLCKGVGDNFFLPISISKYPGVPNGYPQQYIGNIGEKYHIDSEINFHTNYSLPKKFKICTYNIWGIIKKDSPVFALELLDKRMKMIAQEIIENNIDIICFQEMSHQALISLHKYLHGYFTYDYEPTFNIKNRNKSVENFVMSKFPVNSIKMYSLEGLIGYYNSVMVLSLDNCDIYNCYLQAGSKHTLGVNEHWFHYTRCRLNQLRFIKSLINKENKDCIVVGDFNFDLNNKDDEWFEVKEISELSDSWTLCNPTDKGFTEDTDINYMRYNLKQMIKQLRFDGILFKSNKLKPISSKLIGLNYELLDKDDSLLFTNLWLTKNKQIKYIDEKIPLFASDHFGLVTEFIN